MLADRVLHTSTTTGTGSYDLIDPATAEYLSAVASVGSGNRLTYLAKMGTAWEICWGVVTAGSPATLTRNLIRSSTGALINWGAGTKTISSVDQADLARFGSRGPLPTVGGTANALTATHATPMRVLLPQMEVFFRPTAANTSATTLNVDGLGAISLRAPNGIACIGGELQSGVLTSAIYDGTNWVLTSLPVIQLAISSVSGGNLTAPAGTGTRWSCSYLGYSASAFTLNTPFGAKDVDGGALVEAGVLGTIWTGIATRKA